jgi:sulfonate transport system permease protein
MLTIFMIWFGIGDLSKILIIALACFYPVLIREHGLRAVFRRATQRDRCP